MEDNTLRPAVVLGRWLVDERMHAAMELRLPPHDVALTVSVTALDMGPSAICSVTVSCTRRNKTLDFTAALRISQVDVDEPDLAQFLLDHARGRHFQHLVLYPIVARMQVCGMLE